MPFTLAPILNAKPREDKTQHVLIRITKDRVLRYLSTGIYVKDAEFNNKNKRRPIRGTSQRATTLNDVIQDMMDQLEALGLQNPSYTSQQLKELYEKSLEPPAPPLSFSSFWQLEMNRIKAEFKARTGEKYESEYAKFHAFAQKERIEFSDLTVAFIKNYRAYLAKINAPTTLNKSLQFVSRMIKAAMKEGLIEYKDNPFHTITIKRPKGKKDKLTQEEIARIRALDLPTNRRIYHSRNIFICLFYLHGSRIGDVLQLRRKQILLFDDATMLINYEMEKTGADNSIVASPALVTLLLPYLVGKNPDDFIFPFLKPALKNKTGESLLKQIGSKTATINQDLKKVGAILAELTGVEKHITTHVARHTFAHITRAVSGDVYATSKALGHSDVTITEGYLGQDHAALIEKVSSATYRSIEEAAQKLLKPD